MKLLNHYYEVPKDLDIEYSSVFVKRAVRHSQELEERHLDAFVTLFKELQWTLEVRMEVLQHASDSRCMEVLEIFVNVC